MSDTVWNDPAVLGTDWAVLDYRRRVMWPISPDDADELRRPANYVHVGGLVVGVAAAHRLRELGWDVPPFTPSADL